ncbi:PREDICTED: uncharacterized protein LOC109338135 [Lupinus angustifolius]|uniref:uncharacterized protein LOC109338135 n=1 Tax=Lupinus angustifolius TaxID=3871 RepID=UPI00092F21ED|nr:PREDICTED: uncharacterized protein LOC109338135 [Lupinus angustifolius]
MANNNGFTMTLPTLVGKNYERWSLQMKVLFGYQEVLDIVQNGYQSLDEANFEKISNAKTAKEAWENLERSYAGAEKVKKVQLQTLRREYELVQMKEGDSISEYFTKIRSLTNLMKGCGEVMRVQLVVEKVLRTLTPRFDHIVATIKESKDLEVFKIDELQSSLEAYEQGIKERNHENDSEQALQAKFSEKSSSQGNLQKKLKGRWKNDKVKNQEGTRQESGSVS